MLQSCRPLVLHRTMRFTVFCFDFSQRVVVEAPVAPSARLEAKVNLLVCVWLPLPKAIAKSFLGCSHEPPCSASQRANARAIVTSHRCQPEPRKVCSHRPLGVVVAFEHLGQHGQVAQRAVYVDTCGHPHYDSLGLLLAILEALQQRRDATSSRSAL
eukprot:7389738-Prymnesium_polylepis.1